MHKQLVITKMEIKLLFRSFMNVFFALLFPPMMLLLFGEMYGNEPSDLFGGLGTIDVSVPAYICMIIAVTGIMSLPLTVAEYRERKILKRFKATPISQVSILFAQILSSLVLTVLGVGILLVLAILKYRIQFMGNLFTTLAMGLLVTLSIFSIGLVISGVINNAKTASAISFVVYFPMLFLSGATMPLELFPESLRTISNVIPLTHGVKLLRGVWLGGNLLDFTTEIVVLSLITIVFTSVAIKFFKWE
ncbi:MAG: ABC transporter permease [Alkaliphilus sp.]